MADQKDRNKKNQTTEENLPEGLDMIDLEGETEAEAEPLRHFNVFHLIFLALFVLIVGGIVIRIRQTGSFVDLRSVITGEEEEVAADTFDNIMPLLDANGYLVKQEVDTILLFGNSPFADDRDSEDGLANLIAKKTGARVINCAVTGSYQAATEERVYPKENSMDAFIPYWIIMNALDGTTAQFPAEVEEALGDAAPPDGQLAYDNLMSVDLNEVDVCVIFYDLTDYFLDRPIHYDNDFQNPTSYVGSLGDTVVLLRVYYPNIRFIVMGPTYAYYVEEDGSYSDAELRSNSYGKPSDYALWEYSVSADRLGVSYVDNYFHSINCNNASEYLTDNIHINQKGRELLADRLVYFINYYRDGIPQED
ncbi:MAG: SGNH/GDSL hydrolase family protein [Lachnospiraceae bacterium]|nr:SGNH/GDSL hydrolase family protein [Lachnospiraceae bacterium]